MTVEFGRMTVLVDDYDEALEFYTDVFGFEVLADVVLDDGFRALHVGPPGQERVGLWLIEAQGDAERELIGRQTGAQPSFVFYTDDLLETRDTLVDRGATVTSEPDSDASGTFVHFEDLYGNRGVLVELDESAA